MHPGKMAANFKKRSQNVSSSRNPSLPAGSKLSAANNQLFVSSGVPSLDNILGGGIPVGTVLLIFEDKYSTYSDILLKCFVAEGVLSSNGILLASSFSNKANEILEMLPAPSEDETDRSKNIIESSTAKEQKDDDELKIAWRYQNLQKNEHGQRQSHGKFGHYFDLTKQMDKCYLDGLDIHKVISADWKDNTVSPEIQDQMKIDPNLKRIFNEIREVTKNYSTTGTNITKTILRIGVQLFGSLAWPGYKTESEKLGSISWFLLALRTILRSSLAACVVTLPSQLFENTVPFMRRLGQCVDNVIQLESFQGTANETNPLFKEYQGLIHIIKKARINCLLGHDIDTSDWAFKLKRKKFTIEKLHLPPDLSETVSRTSKDSMKPSQTGGTKLCSTAVRSAGKSLDF